MVGIVAVGAVATYLAYARDVQATYDHLPAGSQIIYLRTPLPADTSIIAQAEAFADLLDILGIERGICALYGGATCAAVRPALPGANICPRAALRRAVHATHS